MLRWWMTKLSVSATRCCLTFEDAEFLRVGLCAGDFVGEFFARTLEAELNVIEAGSDERSEFRFIERQAGSNQIDVQAGRARGTDEIDNIDAGERFAAGEVGLED